MAKRDEPTGTTRQEIPDKGTFGWMMRIKRSNRLYQEYFSDARCGGKEAARRAAEARYKELASELPPPDSSKNRLTVRNSTGKVGVRIAHDIGRRSPENEYYSYVASWLTDGREKTIRFSWNKYGEETAFEMACLARDNETQDRAWIESEQLKVKARKARKVSRGEA